MGGFEKFSIEGAHGFNESWNAKQYYFELYLTDLAFSNEKIANENQILKLFEFLYQFKIELKFLAESTNQQIGLSSFQ